MCARFLRHLLLLCIRRVHGAISGCTVLWEVHPASAQTKSLISDTGGSSTCTLLSKISTGSRLHMVAIWIRWPFGYGGHFGYSSQ